MSASQQYFTETITILNQIKDTQTDNISQAADICVNSIAQGGLVFLCENAIPAHSSGNARLKNPALS